MTSLPKSPSNGSARLNQWLRNVRVWHAALACAPCVISALAAASPAGCSDGGGLGPPASGVLPCEDKDGDGFGLGCAAGDDCDDADPASRDECYACEDPTPGCPCDDEGARVMCGKVESKVGDQLVCGLGDSVCTQGVWGECIINNTITLAPQMPGQKAQNLGPPTKCENNPCDPYCHTWNDTPGGLSDPDGGILATDAGITLPGSQPPPPPFCMGGVDGTCAHPICATGAKLTPDCDTPGPAVLFTEAFANNNQGWTKNNNEWEIAVLATVSNSHTLGNPDPANDHTPTADDKIAGVEVGGNTTTSTHSAYYLTSPVINAGPPWSSPVVLSFFRWLNSDVPTKTKHTVEVCNNGGCAVLWENPGAVTDNAWTQVSYTIPPAFVTANMRVRFGVAVVAAGAKKVSSWNIDDITITALPYASCVTAICASTPACCSGSWTQACVDKLGQVCGVVCGNLAGTCVTCFSDAYDHDDDGFTGEQGDCLDCDPSVNPGAFDYPGNGVDENCSGAPDDEATSCDGALALASNSPYDFAKAIELCQTTTAAAKTWGVITPGAAFVQANVNLATGTPVNAPTSLQYGILSKFGPNNLPQKGSRMAAFSSGTAREPGGPGWVNPNGQVSNYQTNNSSAMPPQFPKGNPCFPNALATTAEDSSGMWMQIRTPTNAKSLSFKFNMLSAEYPEWVCTAYNDTFIARLLTGFNSPPNDPANGNNISFDANGRPVTVNNALFTIPGCPTCNSPKLLGTTFDQQCNNQICGGGTDWLITTAPIVPGEIIKVNFEIWDEGDHKWDSTVLIDDWQWSINSATISTTKVPPPQQEIYSDGYFVRDYDASSVCPEGTSVVWALWSWQATAPSDSFVDFKVQTAATLAGLGAAPSDALQFSDPPGPAALKGQSAVAKEGPPNTLNGSAVVDATLQANGRPRSQPFLRVTSHLAPSSDKHSPPTLVAWNLQFDCVPSE